MHSEFACHIGLRGKYFCRVCEVKGSDAADAGTGPIPNTGDTPDNSPAPSAAGSDYDLDESPTAIPPGPPSAERVPNLPTPSPAMSPLSAETAPIPPTPSVPKARGRYQESMFAMLSRIKAFTKV